MKQLFCLLTILLGLSVNAQDYKHNPFEKLGYTPKIATLSQGKYQEFFDLDTIVRIGSVWFNTQSQQIVGLVKIDTIYNEQNLEPELVSRWLSPDPLSHMREWLSPYNFVQNNPIMRIDPDGRLDVVPYHDEETGEYLGAGGTDEIRFISKKDWESGNLENYHTQGALISDEAAEKVMRQYNMNISNGDDELSTDYIDGVVTVNFDKSTIGGSIRNNSDAINFHEHETYSHGKNWIKYGEYNRTQDFWKWEQDAVKHQIRTSSWQNTSTNWKAHIYGAYGKYEWIVPALQQPKFFPKIKLNPISREEYIKRHY